MATRKDAEAIRERASEPMAFFTHDSNAAGDIKCRRLIHRCGLEGYGRWWLLCEILAATEGHAMPVETEEDMIILAEALRFTGPDDVRACRSFVEVMAEIGLVRLEDGEVVSDRMFRNAEYFGRQRHNGGKGGRPRKTQSENGGEL